MIPRHNIKYCFATPDGDLFLSPEDLKQPFLNTPFEAHPFLKLKDYFESIRDFILKDQAAPLCSAIKDQHGMDISFSDIRKIMIRSEKHGALYHISGVDVSIEKKCFKLAVSTAISEQGKICLTRDFSNLGMINNLFEENCLPRAYVMEDIFCKSITGNTAMLTMVLTEWFENFHEWHLMSVKSDRRQSICIWDTKNGNQKASHQEAFEIFRQASKILTLAYNTQDFRQITPWHHAAGDFIVRTHPNKVQVKLTTVRGYRSFMDYFTEDQPNPVIALVYFFLNLTLKMRLDKIDGVGDTIWAAPYSVNATVIGFLEALREMDKKGRYNLGSVDDLQQLLNSFSETEFDQLFASLMCLYEQDDPDDFKMIQKQIKKHIQDVTKALKRPEAE